MSVYFVAENSREYHKIRFLSIIEAKFLPTFFETTQQIDLRKQTMIIPNYSTPNAFFVIRLYNWVILWSPMCLFVLCEGVWGSIFHTVLTKHIFSVRLIVDAKACEQLNNKLRIGWLSHLADWSRMYHWCIYYRSVSRDYPAPRVFPWHSTLSGPLIHIHSTEVSHTQLRFRRDVRMYI